MDEALLPVVSASVLAEQPVIGDWLVLGPFVVETGASFEREYMFERHKILDIDYLQAVGGEAGVRPVQDQAVPNACLGPARLHWQRVRETSIGFTGRTGDLLYRTVQRNAVWYVATYVDSDREQVAFVEAYHSGMRLFLNGELVLDQPYGQAKGLWVRQMLLPVRLRAGRNLFLAKVRPGYIADGVEFCLRNFTVRPALVGNGPVVAVPSPSPYFARRDGGVRQVIEVRCANIGDREIKAGLSLGEQAAQVTLGPGASELVRIPAGLPGTEPAALDLVLEVEGRREAAVFRYQPSAAPETKGTGYVFTDFHFDTTYHEEQRVYAMGAFDIVRRYCEQLERDPLFKCTLSELDYLKPYFDMFPQHRAILRQAHLEGRAESDVFYNQPQELNCCGETFVRNMLYGQLWHEDVLGRRCFIYSPGDVFGHPAQMSQIALKGGCTGVGWDKAIFGFPPLFRHLSPDGTWMVHRRGTPDRQSSLTMGLSSFLAWVDKTAPSDWTRELAPPLQMAVPSEFHEAVQKSSQEAGARLQLTSRDMSLYHAGTALSRIELKIGNRMAENMLISAEKFAAIAGLLGASYPERPLDKAWRQLLCGQHHDSITGTHNELSYVDLMVAYREACELAHDTLADALAYLNQAAAASPRPGEMGLRLFNPHCWDRVDLCRATVTLPEGWSSFGVRDAAGNPVASQVLCREGARVELAFVASVPSLGYATYYLTPDPALPAAQTETVQAVTVENDAFRLTADPERGGLVSLYDKRVDRECLDTSKGLVGGEVSVHREVHNRAETQHELYTTGQAIYGHLKPARVHAQVGPVVRTLVLEQELSDVLPPIRHEISLVTGVDRVDCRIMLADYQYEDDLFVVTYPTNLRGAVPTFDDRYCAIARRPSKDLLDFRTHQMFMFSGCAIYPADRWMEYGPTVTLDLGEAGACTLGMTALVSPADNSLLAATENLTTVLTTKGIPVTPWPDCDQPVIGTMLANVNDDLLYNDFRFVLLTARNANRFADQLLAGVAPELAARFRAEMAKGPAALYLVDCNNRESKPIQTVLLGAPDAEALERLISELGAQLAKGEQVCLPAMAATPAGPVDDYGITLVNTGNIASSVERGGVICLPLFHTCEWYGATGNIEGRDFVPEQRSHVYTYSLVPHPGTWRQAQVYRRALEVNDPILCLPAASGDRLPESACFLSVDAPSVVVTALKAFGNPLAGSRANVEAMPARGLTLRYYEANGRPTRGTFHFLPRIRRAFAANLLEQPGEEMAHESNSLPFACRPFAIETCGVITEPLAKRLVPAELGPQVEPVQPVFVRSWEHDAGTMPMGYETVVASLGRDVEELEDGGLRVKVNVVNDYVDAPASGQVTLLLPQGWSADRTTFDYELPALGEVTFPVTITRPPDSQGQIKLRFTRDGQEFQDVLEVGRAVEPTFTLRLEEGKLVAAVENPGSESLECEVAIASPVETWPAELVGPLSLAEITPRTIGLSVPPGQRQEAVFAVTVDDQPVPSAWWAVGKLMANGRIYLRRVDRRGRHRHWSASAMWQEMHEGKRPRTS